MSKKLLQNIEASEKSEVIYETMLKAGQLFASLYPKFQQYGIGASKMFLRVLRSKLNAPEIKTMLFREFDMNITEWFFNAFDLNHAEAKYSIVMQTTTNDVNVFLDSLIECASELENIYKNADEIFLGEEKKESEEKKEIETKHENNDKAQTKNEAMKEQMNIKTQADVKTEIDQSNHQVKSTAQFSLNIPLNEIVNESVKQYIDSSDILKNIQSFIKAEAQKLQPNVIKIGDNTLGKIEGTLHFKFKEVAALANRERKVFLAGPAGTGKTTLAAQVAKGFDLDFGHISCSAGMSEAHLLGRMTATGDYLESELVRIFENGGVFLFDEIDAADPNTLLVINSALANGVMSVPNRVANPTAKKHENFICICAANTWGTGSIEYSGRAQLDAAFLDRFVGSKVMIGYDVSLEEKIATDKFKNELKAIHKIRENVMTMKIRRVVSTRAIESMARHLSAGEKMNAFFDMFFLGWSNEERTKAMTNVVI